MPRYNQRKQQMLKIRDFTIENPILLAPIAGYTDSPFRKICISKGCGLTVTELISAEGIVRKNNKTLEMLEFHEDERPISIQIFGKDPAVMADAAQIAETYRPELIDINLGCPARKVCNSGSGAALARTPELIEKIATAMVKKCKLPITAKIRIGWDDSEKNYLDVVKALEFSGISMIAVHGRTRAQMYSGKADWDAIKRIKDSTTLPVIGNGDITSYNMAKEMMNKYGVDGVMIGRGAMGNPWIYSGKIPTTDEVKEMIGYHIDLMTEKYGDYGIKLMRKHIVSYIHGFKNSAKVRQEVMHHLTKHEIMKTLEKLGQRQPGSLLHN